MSISKKRLDDLKKQQNKNQIDYSDIPELDNNFWLNAKLLSPVTKKSITLRIDNDLYEYYKSFGKGYQTKIQQILRLYAQSHGLRD